MKSQEIKKKKITNKLSQKDRILIQNPIPQVIINLDESFIVKNDKSLSAERDVSKTTSFIEARNELKIKMPRKNR